MDLNELLVFTRVVQAGSFTAAARALALTKSSVSRKVSELEDRLGARLLQRTTRKLSLTDIGRAYYERATRIVADAEDADLSVIQMQGAPRGLLRVSVPLAFGQLGAVVAEMLLAHPDVRVEIAATDRRVDLVEEGFDLALRVGPLEESTLIARPLGSIRRVLVAAPAYLERRGDPTAPADLRKHDCLLFAASPASATARWVLRSAGKSVEVVPPVPRLVVNDFELVREAARRGAGIACVPEHLCREDLRRGRLRRALAAWAADEAEVHVVYPSTRHVSPKVIAFLELVRARFPALWLTPPT